MSTRSFQSLKRSRPPSSDRTDDVESSSKSASTSSHTPESPQKAKKLKLQASFVAESPYPDFAHPTPIEALEVFNLLSKAHRTHDSVRRIPKDSSNASQTCGNVPNVIEALIGTILSQNTSGKNSTRAKAGLDAVFGRNNFDLIASSPIEKVVEAIRCGGLANKKAATIQNVLTSIKARHGSYTLQHLGANDMKDQDIMQELISYDGVGPKTASCVLLFCLGRDSFAVDTHVFRLSKLLGWVPPKADRILTQAHLDLRVPGELKYGLHVLMIQHGRLCKGCKKAGSGEICILKTYLKEGRSKVDSVEDKVLKAVGDEDES